jgi:hypothetical protein
VQKKRQALIASECDEMQMAAPVMTNEFVGHGNSEKSKPRPSKSERVGHPERQSPEKQNRFLSKDVQEWYHPTVRLCQQKKAKRWATRHSKAATRSGFTFLIFVVCIWAFGCRDVRTIWSMQSKSPDGKWLASAQTEQHGGPGNAGLQTLVYIKPTDGSASPELVLALTPSPGSDLDSSNLGMQWLTPAHLEISYSSKLVVDFKVANIFGIDITYGTR